VFSDSELQRCYYYRVVKRKQLKLKIARNCPKEISCGKIATNFSCENIARNAASEFLGTNPSFHKNRKKLPQNPASVFYSTVRNWPKSSDEFLSLDSRGFSLPDCYCTPTHTRYALECPSHMCDSDIPMYVPFTFHAHTVFVRGNALAQKLPQRECVFAICPRSPPSCPPPYIHTHIPPHTHTQESERERERERERDRERVY